MTKFLSKDEELALGFKIQAMIKAKNELEELNDNTKKEELHEVIIVGERAVEELVQANIPLVISRAQNFKSRFRSAPDIEDLIQEGMEGLMKAVYKYDPTMGNKFSTVAFSWIRQAIGRGTNSTGRLVRLPENRVADYINIKRAQDEFKEKGFAPAEIDNLVMEELKLTKNEFMDIMNAAVTHSSLNKVINESDGSSKELIDYVGQLQAEKSSEEHYVNNSLMEILNSTLEDVSQVKKDILSASFMLDFDGEPMSPKEVRELHNLTSQKFKKLLNEALQEINEELSKRDLTLNHFLTN